MSLPPLSRDDALKRVVHRVAASPDIEATAFPFWGIIEPSPATDRWIAFKAGPFFSRETATEYLRAHRYNYSPEAIVYCFSGQASTEWKNLYIESKGLQS